MKKWKKNRSDVNLSNLCRIRCFSYKENKMYMRIKESGLVLIDSTSKWNGPASINFSPHRLFYNLFWESYFRSVSAILFYERRGENSNARWTLIWWTLCRNGYDLCKPDETGYITLVHRINPGVGLLPSREENIANSITFKYFNH